MSIRCDEFKYKVKEKDNEIQGLNLAIKQLEREKEYEMQKSEKLSSDLDTQRQIHLETSL